MCSICDIIVLNAQEADNCKPPPPLPIILYRGQSCCIWFLAASDCASLGGYHNFFSCGFQATNEKMSTLVSVRQRRHQRRQDQAISRISKLSPFLMLEGTGFCSDDFPTIEKKQMGNQI